MHDNDDNEEEEESNDENDDDNDRNDTIGLDLITVHVTHENQDDLRISGLPHARTSVPGLKLVIEMSHLNLRAGVIATIPPMPPTCVM
ncbi:hypothetical protein PoB_001208600 [Plakobranchus ocellatus]|uniref:Uncharacterized protein n=1 Tax=Plakobranchus ocellatus TaxID=259542 RepID=A0AAV3YE44_9GAST|nr:hypothetical protein PoB_001208600 [Plakobranchus ocellatus]